MGKATHMFSSAVHERAVRIVLDCDQVRHGSRWRAIVTLFGKVNCSASTLNAWSKKVDVGQRVGNSGDTGVKTKP
ncbi:hypothetical protein LX81_04367 [Palleronia aestuarii]|uniref:Transposase n=1 Tax=Palleronia aestuarii TaxID=568105 RepID=A0A2W7MPY6_9RHOB|nr:hypothetical protein [Palleronia aestuarii]PZX09918.1 hypothetical protein LX81_04367 [Palleronia aestuarii]